MASACAVRKYVAGSGCSVPCSSAARPLGKHLHQRRQHCIVGGGARRHGPHGVRARREADQRDQKDGEERDAVVHRLCSLSLSLSLSLLFSIRSKRLAQVAVLCNALFWCCRTWSLPVRVLYSARRGRVPGHMPPQRSFHDVAAN
jgi:hypothetical protein